MLDVRRDNRVVSLTGKVGLKGNLVTMLDQLQRCQKSLNKFLEVRFLQEKTQQKHEQATKTQQNTVEEHSQTQQKHKETYLTV